MSVPKKQISKRRTRARRSHHQATTAQTMACPMPACDASVRTHYACTSCNATWKQMREQMEKSAA